MVSVGIDVGGTGVKGVRLGPDGFIEHSSEAPTTAHDPDTIHDTVVRLAKELGVSPEVPLGVAVAGFIDPTRRLVQFSPNIAWTNRPLASELEESLGVSVVLENDANAACFGEFHRGAGAGATSLAMFTLGTGVGGAVMDGGRLLVGSTGMAGELGHLPIAGNTKSCGCGATGCLETLASGTAIVDRVRELIHQPQAGADEVTEFLRTDESLRNEVFDGVATALAQAIIVVKAVTNPERVVIGGGVMEKSGDVLLERIRQRVSDAISGGFYPAAPDIVAAALGNRAGGIGAALLAAAHHEATL